MKIYTIQDGSWLTPSGIRFMWTWLCTFAAYLVFQIGRLRRYRETGKILAESAIVSFLISVAIFCILAILFYDERNGR